MLPGVFTTQLITTTHSLEIPEQTGIFTLRLILTHEETFTCFAFWYNDKPNQLVLEFWHWIHWG